MQILQRLRSNNTKTLAMSLIGLILLAGGVFLIQKGLSPAKSEALSNVPTTYVTNGQVNAVTKIGNTIYFGGNFSELRTQTGYGLIAAQSNGALASFPNVNGTIYAAEPDGANGWYIAGDFTTVGPAARTGLAHILASGQLDPSFAPTTNGTVNALEFDGSNLYIGGTFTTINGTARNNAGALSAAGALTAFNPNVNGPVSVIAINGSSAYLGGSFSSVGGSTRNNIAAVDKTSGALGAFNPNADAAVFALAIDGSTVYAGGAFANIGGAARNYIAGLDATTGSATAFNPAADGQVKALAVDTGSVYAGGSFNNIGGAARIGLAALNKTTGAASSFNANVNGTVNTIVLGTSNIFFGGSFSNAGGSARSNAAAVNILGSATAFDPNLGGGVNALALSATQAYIGGGFLGAGAPTTRNNVAAINETTGTLTSWNPDTNGMVNALDNDGTNVYMGGDFTTVGAATRNYMARVDGTNGTADIFNPNANAFVNDIEVNGSAVYAAGAFTNIGGQARNRAAALSVLSGLANGFNPNANAVVNTITVNGGTAYLGGNFAMLGSSLRFFIGAVDATTGAVTAWNPGANSAVNDIVVNGSNVYVGGNFTNIASTARNHIAAIDATSGAATAWNPNADSQVHSLALDTTGSQMYVGGSFANIGGAARNNLAAIDLSSGVASAWNVNIDKNKQIPFDLLFTGGQLYAGGSLGQGSDGFVAWFVQPSVQFALAASQGDESVTPANLQVVMSGTDSQDTVINYTITGGSATNGTDYVLAAGSVTIPAGSTSVNIAATVIDDALVEGNETFVVHLNSVSSNAVLGSIVDHTYTILDNDQTAPAGNVIRIPESDPVNQAVEISKINFPNGGAQAAVICRDDIIVDCFVGGPLTNIAGATMLLTNTNTLTPATATELQRVLASGGTVYILGQTQAVSAAVESSVQGLGYVTKRLGGAERIATSVAVATQTQSLNPTLTAKAYLTENRRFVDSIGISAVASEKVSDNQVDLILLNERGSSVLDGNTDAFLSAHPELLRLELIGGTSALSGALESAIGAAHSGLTLSRISGATRWDTNAAIANQYFVAPSTIVLVNGQNANLPGATLTAAGAGGASFYSALLAGNFAGTKSAPLLITQATVLPGQIQSYISAHAATINLAYIVGTTAQISTAIENLVSSII